MELWLKLVLHEGRLVHEAIKADRLELAGKGLDRIATIQRHMIHSWEVLATLTPHDFLTFRGFLRRASGFQSQQYRELERSEERRVGKEWVSTCSSRWSPDHKNKITNSTNILQPSTQHN